ncbi:MAG TPA: SDR family oxidoreductase [Gemmatimonadaceae bacterium]
MDLGLQGKVALVAASSKGLGRAVAHELAAEGAAIIMCARGEEALETAKREIIDQTGAAAIAIAADVATSEGVEQVTRTALDRFGHVDILVINAGGPPAGTFDKHDWSAWQSAVDLTLRSAVELTRAVLPGMRERQWGRIVAVNSIAAKQPVDNLMLSNSIRAAVTGFLRTLANEVATDGITVNTILPGYTRTERVEHLAEANARKEGVDRKEIVGRFEREIPMRRLGEPREFGALAAFLCSERASYITGQSIAVDGGWIKGLL